MARHDGQGEQDGVREGPARPSRRAFLAGLAACACGAAGLGAGVGWDLGRRRPESPELLATAPTKTLGEREHAQPDGLFGVRTSQPVVGLSFDDGPDPTHTPHVLRLLDQHHATATFFLVGINAKAYPALVHDELRGGHTCGNHTFHHPYLEDFDPADVATEIDMAEQAIVAVGAPRPDLFRPPRGYTDTVIDVIADKDRYRTVFWTECVEAFVDERPVEEGVRDLLRQVRPGSLILAHDGGHILTAGYPHTNRHRTMEALPHLLSGLHAMGLRGVSVPELLAAADPR